MVLAIDYGSQWVGLAKGDEEQGIAFPWLVIPNHNEAVLLAEIIKRASEINAGVIVLGKPDGPGDTNQSDIQALQRLETELAKQGFLVEMTSEMYTTAFSRRIHQPSEPRSRKQKRTARLDAAAAALILQTWFDQTTV